MAPPFPIGHLLRTLQACIQRTKGDASLNYFDVVVRCAVCFSVCCTL